MTSPSTLTRLAWSLAISASSRCSPATRSRARGFADVFLEPPSLNNGYASRVEYRWPGHTMSQSFRRSNEDRHGEALPLGGG